MTLEHFKLRLKLFLEKIISEKFLTNVEFAYVCEIDEKTVRRILKCEQNLSIGILLKISSGLNIELSELVKTLEEINI